MKTFSEEEARKMSRMEVMQVVCEGLAEVSALLADKSETLYQQEEFFRVAREFEGLVKIFSSQKPRADRTTKQWRKGRPTPGKQLRELRRRNSRGPLDLGTRTATPPDCEERKKAL